MLTFAIATQNPATAPTKKSDAGLSRSIPVAASVAGALGLAFAVLAL
jgi:hypothetical protein